VAAEGLSSRVLAIVIVELGLGLERLLAHVANELAFAENLKLQIKKQSAFQK
jgi:hypothetical protein